MNITIEIIGLERVMAKCSPAIVDGAFRKFLPPAGIEVTNQARPLATVDTGLMKGSIHTEVKGPRLAEIKPVPFYSIFQELGTSRGVPAVHFMKRGAHAAMGAIRGLVGQLAADIVAAWGG